MSLCLAVFEYHKEFHSCTFLGLSGAKVREVLRFSIGEKRTFQGEIPICGYRPNRPSVSNCATKVVENPDFCKPFAKLMQVCSLICHDDSIAAS
jgi:hypothetical protein